VILVGGKRARGVGGGICQCASTIYSAVKQVSGIKIVERHPHSVPVGYVPVSGEAMVNYGTSDFRFRNDNKFEMFIHAVTDHASGALTASVYKTEPPPSAAKPSVVLDGKPLTFDVPPTIIDNRLYIEIKPLFERLGYAVSYNESTRESRLTRGGESLILEKGAESREIVRVKDGIRTAVPIPYPVKLLANRTMFPVKFASDLAGYNAAWDEASRTAHLTRKVSF
jgi:hypothetical protein